METERDTGTEEALVTARKYLDPGSRQRAMNLENQTLEVPHGPHCALGLCHHVSRSALRLFGVGVLSPALRGLGTIAGMSFGLISELYIELQHVCGNGKRDVSLLGSRKGDAPSQQPPGRGSEHSQHPPPPRPPAPCSL